MTYRDKFLLDEPQRQVWTPEAVKGESWVYLHLSADNEVLYVGRTTNPEQRAKQHDSASSWSGDIVDHVWFGPMTSLNAGQVERELIRAIDPPHNVKHTTRDPGAPKNRPIEERRSALAHRVHRAEQQLDFAVRALLAFDEAEASA